MPAELRTTPLKKCLEKIIDYRGKTPKKLGSDWVESGYRALSANNVKDSGLVSAESIRCVDAETYKKWMKEEVRRGDLLLTSEAPAGEVMVWDSDEKIVLSQRLFALRANDKFDNRFIKYYLQSPTGKREVKRTRSGSTVEGISAEMFDQIQVVHPATKSAQEAIADVLSSLDAKIDLNNRINAELEALAQTFYDYWFVQFDFPDANGKPYKSSGGAMVWSEVLKREIPEGWEAGELGKWISFQRGISYSSSEIGESGAPLINLNSFHLDGRIKIGGTKGFSGRFVDSSRVAPGDLVIAITDVTRNADITGRAFVVPDVFEENPLISCDVAAVHSASGFSPFYLEKLFNSDDYHRYLRPFAAGTLVLHLNLDGVRWFKTFLPPMELIENHGRIAKAIHNKITDNLLQSRELERLRGWLLPLLMNGQARVA